MDVIDLKALEGRRLRVEFRDDQIVCAKLVSVDPYSGTDDLILDEVEVIAWGASDPTAVDSDAAWAAASEDVVSPTPV